jgi:hypothetical protein
LLAIDTAAVVLKVAVVAPASTVTVPGTVSNALLLPSVTPEPPAGAGCVKVTVHVLTALCPRLVGLQARDKMVGTATIAFVTPDTLSLLPSGLTPTALVIVIAVVPAVGASVNVTVAATPAAIMLAFDPVSRQIIEPFAEAQFTVLLAAVATGPGSTEMAEIWLGW